MKLSRQAKRLSQVGTSGFKATARRSSEVSEGPCAASYSPKHDLVRQQAPAFTIFKSAVESKKEQKPERRQL